MIINRWCSPPHRGTPGWRRENGGRMVERLAWFITASLVSLLRDMFANLFQPAPI
jgi:hypothetical protein